VGAPLIETRDDPVVTSERRHPVSSTAPGVRPGRDRGAILVVAASLAASAVYAVLGVGYVLDDWFALRNAHVGGAWAAAGHEQDLARPGASATYALVFGLMGEHPLLVLALQAAIGALTAWVLLTLLRRFLPAGPATLAALCWVVLPNHTALEVWASATNIALALLLTLVGALVLLSGRRRARPAALVLLMAGALAY
jgi:multidrug efflux pump subunit AcrB